MTELSVPEPNKQERSFPAKLYLEKKNIIETGLVKQGLPQEAAEKIARQNSIRLAIPNTFEKKVDTAEFSLDWSYLTESADLSNEDVQSALHLLNNLCANPALVDSYPSQAEASEEQINMWCSEAGVKDASLLKMPFSSNVLSHMITAPRLKELSMPEEMQRTCKDLLPLLQFVRDEKKYLHEVEEIAINNLEKYHPEWVPNEPVQILFEYKKITSEYYGKVRGIHYIVLNPMQYEKSRYHRRIPIYNIYKSLDIPNKTIVGMVLTHEKVHQADVEKSSTSRVLGYNTDSFFSDEEVSRFTPREIVTRIREKKGSVSHDPQNLGQVITEGIATSIELSIWNKEAHSSAESEAAEAYKQSRSRVLDISRENAKWMQHYNAYRIGVDILQQLTPDEDDLALLSQRINRDACFNISYSDPKFHEIIANPASLLQV